MRHTSIPLIVILGPTASGKSALAVRLAKRFSGQIVSADSRQIYKGLEIGAGTVTKKEMQGIPHELLSFRSPKLPYNAAQYKQKAVAAIKRIAKCGSVPFLVGGTGFWIDAVCQNILFPDAKPNATLRLQLSAKSTIQLFAMLKKLDPAKANIIDPGNPHRLIRAIEIARSKSKNKNIAYGPRQFDCLYLGISQDTSVLRQKIRKRFMQWLKQGFLDEVRGLMEQKLSETRFRELGLHYWLAYRYLHRDLSKQEFVEQSVMSIWHYAKRQMTWFRRNKQIRWIDSYQEAKQLVTAFLKKNENYSN